MASSGTLMGLCTPTTISRPGTFSSKRVVHAAGAPAPRMRTSRAHIICAASSESAPDRRAFLGGLFCATVAPSVVPHLAKADETDLVLFQGTASPPTSYGGYGGNASEDFKYQFLVPDNWKPQVINKVEKGTQGIDCKFLNPDVKGMKVFVISLGRAGEDAKSFKITNVEATFEGFAGADYNIQDALATADDITTTTREGEAKEVYYEYDINSPIFHYKSSITTRRGKIFAMFICAPGEVYEKQQPVMDEMIASFKAL